LNADIQAIGDGFLARHLMKRQATQDPFMRRIMFTERIFDGNPYEEKLATTTVCGLFDGIAWICAKGWGTR
jgi:hypothetical protein